MPADGATFLELLTERPDDFDLRLVYADWLEETGEPAHAEFLRLQHALYTSDPDARDLLVRGTQLRTLGESLPAGWVATLSYPPLAGTVWSGHDSMKKSLVLRCLPSGTLSYTQETTRTFENGTWRQIGNVLVAETNQHYADYQGVVVGDSLRGSSHNVASFSWTWSLERTSDPELAQPQGQVVKTIYANHAGARRAAKPRRRRVAAKRASVKKPPVKKPPVKKTSPVKKARAKPMTPKRR